MAVGGNSSGGGSGSIKAGAAYVELFVKNGLTRGLGDAAKTFQNFGNQIGSIGRKVAGVGIAAGAGLAAVFAGSVKKSAEFGMLSLKFGDTAENLSALAYAAGQMSLEQEELFAGFKKLPAAIDGAINGSEELASVFATLNLNAEKMQGQSFTDNILEFADALNATGMNDNSRLAILQSVFGKGGQQFNEFLGGGSAEIRKMMTEAAEVGAVVTGEQAKQAKQIEDAFTKAWKAVKNTILSVGDALLPQAENIDRIVNGIAQVTAQVRGWVAANREVVIGVGLAAAGLTTIGIGLAILGPAIAALAAGWSAFMGVVAVGKAVIAGTMAILAAPILAIPAALAAAGAAWLAFTEQGRGVVDQFALTISNALTPTWENLKSGWKGVVSAVQRGDLAMAFKIGLATLNVEWLRFTNFMETMWDNLLTAIDKKWTTFTDTKFVKGLNKIGDELEMWFDDIIDFDPLNPLDLVDPLKLRNALDGEEVIKKREPEQGFIKAIGMKPGELAIQNAMRERDALLLQNALAGWNQAGGGQGGPLGGGPIIGNPDIEKKISNLQDIVRSSVGGRAGLGMFGTSSVGNQIADNTKKTAATMDDLLAFVRTNGLVYQ